MPTAAALAAAGRHISRGWLILGNLLIIGSHFLPRAGALVLILAGAIVLLLNLTGALLALHREVPLGTLVRALAARRSR